MLRMAADHVLSHTKEGSVMLFSVLQVLCVLPQTHLGSQWNTFSSDVCLKAALWVATYTSEGNSDFISLISWMRCTTLWNIHTYATLKFILKMQIIPMSNINSVSAEPSYDDSTKAHFASVPLSVCPMLSIKWHDRLCFSVREMVKN